jgi:hypothetical protein
MREDTEFHADMMAAMAHIYDITSENYTTAVNYGWGWGWRCGISKERTYKLIN